MQIPSFETSHRDDPADHALETIEALDAGGDDWKTALEQEFSCIGDFLEEFAQTKTKDVRGGQDGLKGAPAAHDHLYKSFRECRTNQTFLVMTLPDRVALQGIHQLGDVDVLRAAYCAVVTGSTVPESVALRS